MTYLVCLFSSKAPHVQAVGRWRVTAETPDQAVCIAKLRASPRIWPPDSAWMVFPVPSEEIRITKSEIRNKTKTVNPRVPNEEISAHRL